MSQFYVRTSQLDVLGVDKSSSGYLEAPTIDASATNGRVSGRAHVAYCANDLPNPTFQFAFSLGRVGDDPDADAELSRVVCRLTVINNVRRQDVSATRGKVTDFTFNFYNRQEKFYVGCNEYGSQYNSRLVVSCTFSFDFELEPVAVVAANDDDGRDEECVMCMDARAVMLNEACAHAVLCVACSFKYIEGRGQTCPKCRAPISRLYLETKGESSVATAVVAADDKGDDDDDPYEAKKGAAAPPQNDNGAEVVSSRAVELRRICEENAYMDHDLPSPFQ